MSYWKTVYSKSYSHQNFQPFSTLYTCSVSFDGCVIYVDDQDGVTWMEIFFQHGAELCRC